MDPFTVVTLLSSYATGVKIGNLFSNWIYGKNISHLGKGCEYLTKGVDNHDSAFVKKAVSEFDLIDEDEDRLFVVAISYYLRAVSYTFLLNFSLAYHFLDKLEAIDYDFFTLKKETIDDVKSEGRNLRPEVKKIEMAVLNAHSNDEEPETEIDWKKVSIFLLLIIVIGLVVCTFFFIF